MKPKPKATIWEHTLSQPAAGGHQCTGSPHTVHPKIPAVITQTEVLPAPHHDFLWCFSCLLIDFAFPSRNSFQAHYWADVIWKELLSLRNVVENMKPQWKLYLETSHVMSLNFVMVNMLLLFSNNLGRVTVFFPRNQVLYCYVTKVNNDSLNDPKKKNWRLAPLKGICTGKFDNVTNHSSKHYLKVFSLRWASQEHAETTALCGCAVTFTWLCFSILKDWYRKRSISKGQHEELEAVSQPVFSVPGTLRLRDQLCPWNAYFNSTWVWLNTPKTTPQRPLKTLVPN